MFRKITLASVSLLLALNTVPVIAESETAIDVLKSIGEVGLSQYYNFNNETSYYLKQPDAEIDNQFHISTQVNFSEEDPQIQIILDSDVESDQMETMSGAIITGNKLFEYHNYDGGSWELESEDAKEYLDFAMVAINEFKENLDYTNLEMEFIAKYTDFFADEDYFTFTLKQDIDALELTEDLYKVFGEAINQKFDDESLDLTSEEIITVELVEDFLNAKPELSVHFYKDTYLLSSVNFVSNDPDFVVDFSSKFDQYGEVEPIQEPKNFKEPYDEPIYDDEIIETTDLDISEIEGKSFIHENIEVEITRAYLTSERYEFDEKSYDHVITIDYIIKNNSDIAFYPGSELEMYVDDFSATEVYLPSDSSFKQLTPGRKGRISKSFGFDEKIKNIELELLDPTQYDNEKPIIIKILEGEFAE